MTKLDRAYDHLAPVEYERNHAEKRVLHKPPAFACCVAVGSGAKREAAHKDVIGSACM
jgi:hypothetical protein